MDGPITWGVRERAVYGLMDCSIKFGEWVWGSTWCVGSCFQLCGESVWGIVRCMGSWSVPLCHSGNARNKREHTKTHIGGRWNQKSSSETQVYILKRSFSDHECCLVWKRTEGLRRIKRSVPSRRRRLEAFCWSLYSPCDLLDHALLSQAIQSGWGQPRVK